MNFVKTMPPRPPIITRMPRTSESGAHQGLRGFLRLVAVRPLPGRFPPPRPVDFAPDVLVRPDELPRPELLLRPGDLPAPYTPPPPVPLPPQAPAAQSLPSQPPPELPEPADAEPREPYVLPDRPVEADARPEPRLGSCPDRGDP